MARSDEIQLHHLDVATEVIRKYTKHHRGGAFKLEEMYDIVRAIPIHRMSRKERRSVEEFYSFWCKHFLEKA